MRKNEDLQIKINLNKYKRCLVFRKEVASSYKNIFFEFVKN